MAETIKPTENDIISAKIPNGGRSVSITYTDNNGAEQRVTFVIDTINSYTPSWTKEYTDEFITWDGRSIKSCKGIRFALNFGIYALTYEKLQQILAAFEKKEFDIICPEFSGTVICDSISPPVRSSNFYGTFYELSVSLSAASLITDDSGCL